MDSNTLVAKLLDLRNSQIAIKSKQKVSTSDISVKVTTKSVAYTIPAYLSLFADLTFTSTQQKYGFVELNHNSDHTVELRPKLVTSPYATGFRIRINNNTGSVQNRTITWYVLSTDTGVIS